MSIYILINLLEAFPENTKPLANVGLMMAQHHTQRAEQKQHMRGEGGDDGHVGHTRLEERTSFERQVI